MPLSAVSTIRKWWRPRPHKGRRRAVPRHLNGSPGCPGHVWRCDEPAFEQVGGFDSSLFLYWEDADLSWRLARLGQLVHCWDAVFEHDRAPKSFKSSFYFVRNGLIVQKRWHRNGSLVKEALAAGRALRTGNLRLTAAECAGSFAYLAQSLGRSTSAEPGGPRVRALPARVLHLADIVNRFDFVDNVVRHLNRERFESEVCTFTSEVNIAPPGYAEAAIYHKVLEIGSRQEYPLAGLRVGEPPTQPRDRYRARSPLRSK